MRTSNPTARPETANDATTEAATDLTASSLPSRTGRTWSEFLQHASQRAGLATAMMGAGLGLTGFGGVEQKRAEAGIVISFDPNADQRARDNGVGYTVEGGGNVGWFRRESELGIRYSSMVVVDPFTAIASAHQFDSFGVDWSYSVGTGANFNNGPSFTPSNIFIHPDYGGAAGQGVDLAVLKFTSPIPIANDLIFAPGRPALNETVWFAGYGVTGSRDRGYVGQDGFLRAGTSIARLSPPLLGGSAELYQNALFEDFLDNPTGLRTASGDSGGGVFTMDGRLTGIVIGGSTSVTGSTSMFLSTSAPPVRDFIDFHTTAVPEPSSLAMLSVLAAGASLYRLRRRQKAD